MPARLIYFAASFGIAALTIYLLVSGRDLLIPIAIAIMIWYLLNAVARGIGRFAVAGWHPPHWLCLIAAVLAFVAAILALAEMVSGNIQEVVRAAPTYQANLERLIVDISRTFGIKKELNLTQLVDQIDVGAVIGNLASTLTTFAGDAGIILVYVVFLMFEQGSFDKKLVALFPESDRQKSIRALMTHMSREIQTYVSIKTLMSLLTGGLSFLVLALVGVHFAEFWGVIIFLLNYIPTIGSLLGIIFPALLTLVQFQEPAVPFAIVTPSLAIIQLLVGNALEPRLMGRSLNVSPLVIIVSLAVWGSIWGIPGMFLCVPITVIVMIVFSHFPRTRPLAVLLSSRGEVTYAETENEQNGR